MPRSGISESYGNSSFSFLRKLHTVFYSVVAMPALCVCIFVYSDTLSLFLNTNSIQKKQTNKKNMVSEIKGFAIK